MTSTTRDAGLRDNIKKKIQQKKMQLREQIERGKETVREKAKEVLEPHLRYPEPPQPQRVDLPDIARTEEGTAVRFNAGDTVEFDSADNMGTSEAIVDIKYNELQADAYSVPDGTTGTVVGVGTIDVGEGGPTEYVMVQLGLDEMQQPITYGFRMTDVVNMAEEHERKWGKHTITVTAEEFEENENLIVTGEEMKEGDNLIVTAEDLDRGGFVEETKEAIAEPTKEAVGSLESRSADQARGDDATEGTPEDKTAEEFEDLTQLQEQLEDVANAAQDLERAEVPAMTETRGTPTVAKTITVTSKSFENDQTLLIEAADLDQNTAALKLRRTGYQRYEGTCNGKRVRIALKEHIQHGTYGPGRRQRRSKEWEVKVSNSVVGYATSLREARQLALTSSFIKQARDEKPKEVFTWNDLQLAVEYHAGELRGEEWGQPMPVPYDYGYILDTEAEDGDSIDFVRGTYPKSESVFVATQRDSDTGEFTQFKLLIEFENQAQAEAAFKLMWPSKMFAGMVELPMNEFIEFTLPNLDVSEERMAAQNVIVTGTDIIRTDARKKPEKQEGETVGVFLEVPETMAAQWPKNRGGDDESPPHFTILYAGEIPDQRRDEFLRIVHDIIDGFPPIVVELSEGVEWFENHEGQQIAHKGVTEDSKRDMEELHNQLREALEAEGFDIKHKEGFIAHSTLEYCDDRNYDGPVPEGAWTANFADVWGWSEDLGFDMSGEQTRIELAAFTFRGEDKDRPKIPRWVAPGTPIPPEYLPEEEKSMEVSQLPEISYEPGLSFNPEEEIRMGIQEGRFREELESGDWPNVPIEILTRYENRDWGAPFWQWAYRSPAGEKWLSSPQGADFLLALDDDFVQPMGSWTVCESCHAGTLADDLCWRCGLNPTQKLVHGALVVVGDDVVHNSSIFITAEDTVSPVTDMPYPAEPELPEMEQPESRILTSTKDLKTMRKGKDALAAAGYPPDQVATFVDSYYKPEMYMPLLQHEDIVYLVMPSTTGKNTVPNVLAARLKHDFGGEIVEGLGSPTHLSEAKCRSGFITRLKEPSGYTLNEQVGDLEAMGKHVVVVDDVFNTGESTAAFGRELKERGININNTAVLGASDTRLANDRDITRLANRTRAVLNLQYDIRPYIAAAFENTSKQWINYAERSVAKSAVSARRVLEYARRMGRETVEKNADITITAADVRVIDTMTAPSTRKKKKRFMGETYYIRPGEWVAYSTQRALGGANDVEEIMLDPAAKVLKEGDKPYIDALDKSPEDAASLLIATNLITEAMRNGYDAVRIGELLAILNEKAIQLSKVDRLGWAG